MGSAASKGGRLTEDADSSTRRKARGAFFTPAEIARFIADWAVRSPSDTVLEPTCGEASFLLSAGERLRVLGCDDRSWGRQLRGIEIHKESAENARSIVRKAGLNADITIADFFDCEPPNDRYDVVIGNPPYVRYQRFGGHVRAKSRETALAQGVRLNGLASFWAASVVYASAFLKPQGRLGFVLPAELLSVSYAAEVRRFLLNRFASVRLVVFEDRVFPGVLEEVVLLLAEGSGGARFFEVHQARNLDGLAPVEKAIWTEHKPKADEKWTPALISGPNLESYKKLSTGAGFSPLLDWGDTYLGAVTGNNGYFALRRSDIARRRLASEDVIRISPPGSRHLRELNFTAEAWESLANADARCFLFYPYRPLHESAKRYAKRGENLGVNLAYKCSVRSPWWKVPIVRKPDLFLTYMNHDRPRFVANTAGVDILNSVYGIALKHGHKTIGREFLPVACLNSVTLLGAEVVGRAYGGGLLKLEPTEADKLPVPSFQLIDSVATGIRRIRQDLSVALEQNDIAKAVDMVDRIILKDAFDVSDSDLAGLRSARELFFQRRRTRGRVISGKN